MDNDEYEKGFNEAIKMVLRFIDERELAYQANNQTMKAAAISILYRDISELFEGRVKITK